MLHEILKECEIHYVNDCCCSQQCNFEREYHSECFRCCIYDYSDKDDDDDDDINYIGNGCGNQDEDNDDNNQDDDNSFNDNKDYDVDDNDDDNNVDDGDHHQAMNYSSDMFQG